MATAHSHPASNAPISVEAQKSLAGKSLEPDSPAAPAPFGYFVALDESGSPTGSVTPDRPPGPHVSVMLVQPKQEDVLTTPTGAPITGIMNPNHTQHDAGMLERNPSGPPHTNKAPTTGVSESPKAPPPPKK